MENDIIITSFARKCDAMSMVSFSFHVGATLAGNQND